MVATLLFDAVGTGSTELDFVFDQFNDVKGRDGAVLPVVASRASIEVAAPVPEPSAALLFAVGAALVLPTLRRDAGRVPL